VQVAVVSHTAIAHELGLLEPWVDEISGGRVRRLYREDGVSASDLQGADLLIVLGSPGSVATGHCPPAAQHEIELVKEWVEADRPYLGICFGAQVLACALGGSVRRMAQTYRAYDPLPLEPDAPASLAGPWVLWHEDAITRPESSTPLAVLPHADIAFRQGRAWGLQAHVEVTAQSLERMLFALGVDPDIAAPYLQDVHDAEASADPPAHRARRLLNDFAEFVNL
jgi:GMP synthase (glutamine-hydrolysing)